MLDSTHLTMSEEATATSATRNEQEDDDAILNQMWGECFIGKMISTDIYVAINESNDRNRVKTKLASRHHVIIHKSLTTLYDISQSLSAVSSCNTGDGQSYSYSKRLHSPEEASFRRRGYVALPSDGNQDPRQASRGQHRIASSHPRRCARSLS